MILKIPAGVGIIIPDDMLEAVAGLGCRLHHSLTGAFMKRIFALVIPLALIATPALAKTVKFKFKNSTTTAVTEFYLSLPSTDDWEENLVSSPIRPGESVSSSISQTDSCVYDVKTVFDDGSTTEDRGWNFCEDPNYNIEEE
jgi:hypothetical protein